MHTACMIPVANLQLLPVPALVCRVRPHILEAAAIPMHLPSHAADSPSPASAGPRTLLGLVADAGRDVVVQFRDGGRAVLGGVMVSMEEMLRALAAAAEAAGQLGAAGGACSFQLGGFARSAGDCPAGSSWEEAAALRQQQLQAAESLFGPDNRACIAGTLHRSVNSLATLALLHCAPTHYTRCCQYRWRVNHGILTISFSLL